MTKMDRMIWMARKPVETILFIVSLMLLASSLYIMSPIFEVADAAQLSPIAQAFNGRLEQFVFGSIMLAASLPGLIAPFVKLPRPKYLKSSAFVLFLTFLFLSIIRIIVYGTVPLTWLPLFALALICGECRIFLEVKKD